MRIAMIAPLYESVPPLLYGGTERVVSFLTEELVAQGHDVTLFASGDSVTKATLVPVWDRALRLDARDPEATSLHVLMLEQVFRRAREFDVMHFHIDAIQLPMARRSPVPCVMTMHGRLDLTGLKELYDEYVELPLVSISNAQRAPLPDAPWAATVYHGLPADLFQPNGHPGEYLAFLGRISPEKRVDRAIEIARQSGVPLRIAAKVDRVDREYFERRIEPMIDGDFIQYLGEIDDDGKGQFLREALALLFPIDWPEPFGLAMIEAMAAGTPVLAFPCGSVREVIDVGITGHIVESVEQAVSHVPDLHTWDRQRCREQFERRFTAERMAHDYVNVYRHVIDVKARRRCA
ncbi:MAG: glycosyltransferase family 4 protein [Gemmatimonadaceae bacterium]